MWSKKTEYAVSRKYSLEKSESQNRDKGERKNEQGGGGLLSYNETEHSFKDSHIKKEVIFIPSQFKINIPARRSFHISNQNIS